MIVDGSQILLSYPFIIVSRQASDNVLSFIKTNGSYMGTVVDVYSGCDWVFIDDVVAYRDDDIEQIRYNNIIYDIIPKENILFTYIASLA